MLQVKRLSKIQSKCLLTKQQPGSSHCSSPPSCSVASSRINPGAWATPDASMWIHIKSKPPAQAAGDAPGNSWLGPTELCVFPGLLPSSGSKTLWLSQHCSHIYPLTLCLSLPPPCFSPSLSLCVRHTTPSLPLTHALIYSLNFFTKGAHSLKQCLLKWTRGCEWDKKNPFLHLSPFLPFLLVIPMLLLS